MRGILTIGLLGGMAATTVFATVHTLDPGTNLSLFFDTQVQDGDTVLLKPGLHTGIYASGIVSNVILRSQDPANPAIIRGGAIMMSSASHVTISDLTIEQTAGNFLNITDGGNVATPSTDITFRNLTLRAPIGAGTNGIKVAGVDGFLVEKCTFEGFGDIAAIGIDGVGVHQGVVRNNNFASSGDLGYGIQFKGGSKDIVIRANRFDHAGSRGINNGGSTGDPYFRPQPPPGYESTNIVVDGNVFSGGKSPHAFASNDGGAFRYNLVYCPTQNLQRILTESVIGGVTYQAKNGEIVGNRFIWNQGGLSGGEYINVGSDTLPETFTFAGNSWYNRTNPANSTPFLPTIETGGIYGVNPNVSPDDVVPWKFDWGLWAVNATLNPDSFSLLGQSTEPLYVATPGADGLFDPTQANPLIGEWTFQAAGDTLNMAAMSDVVLVNQSLVPEPTVLSLLVVPGLLLLRRRDR